MTTVSFESDVMKVIHDAVFSFPVFTGLTT